MTQKHTPGPWKYDGITKTEEGHAWIITVAPGRTISVEGRSAEEADANARFIVACEKAMREAGGINPEAVPEIMRLLEELRTTDHDSFILMRGDLGSRLEAAIDRAKGI